MGLPLSLPRGRAWVGVLFTAECPKNLNPSKNRLTNIHFWRIVAFQNRSFDPKRSVLMKRVSTLILILAILGVIGDCIGIYNGGINLDRHIPFLLPAVFLLFWFMLAWAENRPTNRLQSETPANDDGIPEHARMRANTPDGLG